MLRRDPDHASAEGLAKAWLILSVGCTLANFCWDLFADWGLGALRLPHVEDVAKEGANGSNAEAKEVPQKRSLHKLLTTVPRGRHYTMGAYLFAATFNGLSRFGWAVYVSPHQNVVAQHTVEHLPVLTLLCLFLSSSFC